MTRLGLESVMVHPPPDVPFLERGGTLYAGAGAGKTSSCVALHARARDERCRCLLITFTNNTVSDYISRANREFPGLASKKDVYTFHKLASAVIAGGPCGKEPGSLDTVVAMAVERVDACGVPVEFEDVRVVIVDEAQDCSRENYDLARKLAEGCGATLIMVGDANQTLYRFRNASPSFLLNHAASIADRKEKRRGFEHTLAHNWRSTPEIVALTKEFMRHPIDAKPSPFAQNGPLPRLVVRDPKAIVSELIELASDAIARGLTVMLVGRSKRPRSERGKVVRMGLQTVVNDFERRGTPFSRMFREVADDEGVAPGASGIAPGKINVLTIHGSKGLEADFVIALDALDERVDAIESPDQLELMYVAFSRARRELVVVNSTHGLCDPTLLRCVRTGKCVQDGAADDDAQAISRASRGRYTVTQLLTDRTLVGETELLELSRALQIEAKAYERCGGGMPVEAADLPESGDLQTVYGSVAENCAQMTYHASRADSGEGPPLSIVIERLAAYLENRIVVPMSHAKSLGILYHTSCVPRSRPVPRSDLVALREKMARDPARFGRMLALAEFACEAMKDSGLESAVLCAPSSTQRMPLGELRSVLSAYRSARSNSERLPHIFAACMFFHQLDNHAGYRWGRDYSSHVKAFGPHLKRIAAMTSALPDGCVFEKDVHFRHLRLSGRVDVSCPGRVLEFKFANQLSLTHYMQPCLYGVLDGDRFVKRAEVWNLASGEKVAVKYDNGPFNRWRLFDSLSTMLGKKVDITDIRATPRAIGMRLHTDALRATCDVDGPEDVVGAISFTTADPSEVLESARPDLQSAEPEALACA